MKIIFVLTALVALTAPAAAQNINLMTDKPPMTEEERARRQAIDDAYKAKIKQIPDQKASSDPWGSVRSAPATTSSQTHKPKPN